MYPARCEIMEGKQAYNATGTCNSSSLESQLISVIYLNVVKSWNANVY